MRVVALAMMTAGMLAAGGVTAALATTTGPATPVPCSPGAVTLGEGDMVTEGGKYFEYVRLTLTNDSKKPCVVGAHPAVTLSGPGGGTVGEQGSGASSGTFAVPQIGEQLRLTLEVGEAAHSTVRVRVMPEATDPWQPSALRLTLGADAGDLTWPEGLAIVQQDATVEPMTRGA
jgi:hypothetical protein